MQPSPTKIDVRRADPAEADVLLKLINAAFQAESFIFEGDRLVLAEVERRFKTGAFLLAEESEKPAGCVHVELRGERAYLSLLSIDSIRQGRGLGRLLVSSAGEYARASGCVAMDLRVVSPRADVLVPFYERLGYRKTFTASLPPGARPKVPCHFIYLAKALK